jgi:hypothetical protein
MDLDRVLLRLMHNANIVTALAADIGAAQAIWKPSPEAWSILEVINHLYDEEREDFRTRLDIILHRPDEPWPPIHPSSWAMERRYNDRDLEESLENFLAERRTSLDWLRGLNNPDWSNQSTHPAGYIFSAGDMLSSWLAHDFLHIRQLNELHYRFHAEWVAPFQVIYAGDW